MHGPLYSKSDGSMAGASYHPFASQHVLVMPWIYGKPATNTMPIQCIVKVQINKGVLADMYMQVLQAIFMSQRMVIVYLFDYVNPHCTNLSSASNRLPTALEAMLVLLNNR